MAGMAHRAKEGEALVKWGVCMSRQGRPNIATRLIVDDFGQMALFRRCGQCRSWFPQAIGFFSPRNRDEKRRVTRWDNRCLWCRRANRREWWDGLSIERRQEINQRRWRRMKSDPELLAQRRRDNRELMARRREDPELGERLREAHRAWYRRVKADPAKYAAYLERARINYRLRQERDGRRLEEIRRDSTVRYSDNHVFTLPAKPLADAIDHWLGSRPLMVDNSEAVLRAHGVEVRSLTDWRNGVRSSVQFPVADAALTGFGWNWWDVWAPDEYPDVAREMGMEAA